MEGAGGKLRLLKTCSAPPMGALGFPRPRDHPETKTTGRLTWPNHTRKEGVRAPVTANQSPKQGSVHPEVPLLTIWGRKLGVRRTGSDFLAAPERVEQEYIL